MDHLLPNPPEKLQKILGLEEPLRNEELVDVLQYKQLLSVNCTPIGKGARGIVYQADWKRPQRSDMSGPEEITVALKAMTITDPNYQKQFLKEVGVYHRYR